MDANTKRIALLKVRVAMRFRFDSNRPPAPTREEAIEEQRADLVHLSNGVYHELIEEGLIEYHDGAAMRLTQAGKDELEKTKPSVAPSASLRWQAICPKCGDRFAVDMAELNRQAAADGVTVECPGCHTIYKG